MPKKQHKPETMVQHLHKVNPAFLKHCYQKMNEVGIEPSPTMFFLLNQARRYGEGEELKRLNEKLTKGVFHV